MSMKAVVLAAGEGTRMKPLTLRRPKPLVPVAGRPIIEHILGGLAAGGFDRIGLIVGYMASALRERLGDGRRLGATITHIRQQPGKGTGTATLSAREFVGDEPFFLGWGDIIVPRRSYREIREIWEAERPEALLSVNRVDDPYEGAAVYVEDGHARRIIEKPEKGTSTTSYNNAGLFVFGPELMELLERTPPSPRGEIEVPSAVDAMLAAGARIRAYEIPGYWSDVARPSTALWISGKMIADASRAGVIVHPDARLSASALLEPPVFIGAGAEVAAARLGPNVTVMEQAQVGGGAKLSDVCLLPRAQVGAGARLEHAIVEQGARVPDASTLMGTCEQALVVEVAEDG